MSGAHLILIIKQFFVATLNYGTLDRSHKPVIGRDES